MMWGQTAGSVQRAAQRYEQLGRQQSACRGQHSSMNSWVDNSQRAEGSTTVYRPGQNSTVGVIIMIIVIIIIAIIIIITTAVAAGQSAVTVV